MSGISTVGMIAWLITAGAIAAQAPPPPNDSLAVKDSLSAKDTKTLITPFVTPGYTPEQGALLSLGALVSFRAGPLFIPGKRKMVQRSTLVVNGSYSTAKAVTASAKLATFLAGDRLRIYADLQFKDMPDHYFGVGFEAGKAPPGDSTTAYQRMSVSFLPKILWRLRPSVYIGPMFDINATTASEVSPGMAADPYYQKFGPSDRNTGFGVVLQYDSRDVAANPWSGVYFNAQAMGYAGALGSDNTYQAYEFDYRQYRQLGRKGRTIAWTIRTRFTAGDVPWAELSMLASANELRGYRQGRYRDKATLYGIAEYRHQFTSAKRESGLGRNGLVVWVGAGSLAPTLGEFESVLPNWGVGYRFELQPRMSARMDIGFGKEFKASGDKFVPSVYFSFAEAF